MNSPARSLVTLLLVVLLASETLPTGAQTNKSSEQIDGFTADQAQSQSQLEIRFRAVPSTESAREHLRRLTAVPHVAGTKADYDTAIYVRDQMRSSGLNAELNEYEVLLPYPKRPAIVEIVAPRSLRLSVKEAEIPEDSSSSHRDIIPLFNGYSPSGDVTAPVVYVNYGLPNDYDSLEKLGVDVKGKIALARYGNSFRGVKAKVAEEKGAMGLIIYSDPADDGYVQGDVYPRGPWRPATSAQRGSVQYIFQYPGDPLTPGKPSVPGVPRLKIEDAKNLTRIPVQPISYGEARKILEILGGPLRPRGFQGGLPFAYHVGGTTSVKVHLKTEMDYQIRKIWNVVARIEGSEEPDRWVVLGNHRDAWTFGAVDPNSGSTAMLEVARGLGALMKNGWRPRRTILLCSWDGEEYGLVGSTEWVEEHANELKKKAVAYLNMDAAVSGPNFGASSVPTMWRLIREVTRDIRDPKTGKSVYQQWSDRTQDSRADASQNEPSIGPLGSGSDYTPFLQHLGITSVDMRFGGDYGVYHSAYDSFHWMSRFGDPTFEYHVAAAQVWGTLALRLVNAVVLPFDYASYADEIRRFFQESLHMTRSRGVLNEKSMTAALDEFAKESSQFELSRQAALADMATEESSGSEAKVRRLNDAMIQAERALIDERGLRGRPWYRHQIYAPGFYTGYAAQPLPDFRQALEDRNEANAKEALDRVVTAISRASDILKKARD